MDAGAAGSEPGLRAGLAELAVFAAAYGAKFPKAAAKTTDDLAEHWVHLRTTNPIESTFATVRHQTKITRCFPAAGLAMVFKLIEAAQPTGAP